MSISVPRDAVAVESPETGGPPLEPLVLAEQISLLHERSLVALATVVVNATVVTAVFWRRSPRVASLLWLAALVLLSVARALAARAYRSRDRAPAEARTWARIFVAGAALNGVGWGASALIFHVPDSPAHQMFMAFVLGGMAAGAAASNASHTPAFVAFTVPALLPITVRFAAARDPMHAAMAFMLALFGVAVTAISRAGSRAVENAIRLRLRNEALVADLTGAQDRLVALNAGLEQRVAERTSELERMLKLRLESEAKLAQAGLLASLGSLAAGVAHEINNPLAYILANLQHLATDIRESPSLSPTEKDAFEEIVLDSLEGARRAKCIVRDLGSLSPREKVELEPVDVCAVLESCVNVATNEIRHRAALVRELSVVPPVMGDRNRLAQVFLNLLLNAAHSIPEGAAAAHRITVRTRFDAAEGTVQVEVADTGTGIPAPILDRIFEPFFTTKPFGRGTGLGLSICRSIVLALGGQIAVQSRPGEGSTFTVSLRAASTAVAPRTTLSPQGAITDLERAARLLIVDDDPGVARALRRALPQQDVTVAIGGAAGLSALEQRDFDVVLCDVMMPDVTGMDVHRGLAELRPGAELGIVFVTGGTFTESARAFLAAVPNPRVTKPFEAEDVRAAVRSALALRPPRG